MSFFKIIINTKYRKAHYATGRNGIKFEILKFYEQQRLVLGHYIVATTIPFIFSCLTHFLVHSWAIFGYLWSDPFLDAYGQTHFWAIFLF